MTDTARRLMWHGALLLLLGLLSGFAGPSYANPRMGLSAHLGGVMNALLLLVVGALWPAITLSPRQASALVALALYGTYANWAVTTFAAVAGTGALTPIAGAGYSALPWQETLVTLGFASVGVTMLGMAILLLLGLRRRGTA